MGIGTSIQGARRKGTISWTSRRKRGNTTFSYLKEIEGGNPHWYRAYDASEHAEGASDRGPNAGSMKRGSTRAVSITLNTNYGAYKLQDYAG